MKRQKLVVDTELLPRLLGEVVEKVNAVTMILRSTAQGRGKEYRSAERKLGESPSVTALMALGPDKNELEMWRQYSMTERADIAAPFNDLAKYGKLSRDVIEEQFAALRSGMSYTLNTGLRDGLPVVEPKMEFATLESKVAFVLLTLAGGKDRYQVLQCAHKDCGRLFIRLPTNKGPKPEACELHVNAYRQARHRADVKKRRAAKHK